MATNGKVVIRITGATAGSITVKHNTTNLQTVSYTEKDRYILINTAQTGILTITPTSDFNGTVNYCSATIYSTSTIKQNEFTLISADTHPTLIDGNLLYIGS
jgi:hypothetical protein